MRRNNARRSPCNGMYAIGILPLVKRLQRIDTKQAWFADNATAGGELTGIKEWWSKLQKYGPIYEYFPNSSKTWLIVKEESLEWIYLAIRK